MVGVFELFPFTDEHELNLDWILDVIKNSKSIDRVELLSKTGRVATYRIYYTTGDYYDFRVSDGADYVLTEADKQEIARLAAEIGTGADGAGAHNAVYRGDFLGNDVTDAQWAAIGDGTFRDMYIGDYWTINGVTYRIAAFDYYTQTGDSYKSGHHVTIVPDSPMYTAQMNESNSTASGYVGSKMYNEGLVNAKTTINNAFGAAHIYKHRRYLSTSSNTGAWTVSSVELMTEQNVYGCKVFGATFPVVDKSQYPLFALRPDMISNGGWFWLRDVANNERFAWVSNYGDANYGFASRSAGVRPSFSICDMIHIDAV